MSDKSAFEIETLTKEKDEDVSNSCVVIAKDFETAIKKFKDSDLCDDEQEIIRVEKVSPIALE